MRTLADILPSDLNNFTLVRLGAASAVIASHAYFQTGNVEPLAQVTKFDLGDHAVNVFFVLSGLTVAASLARRRDLWAYGRARLLRIFPGFLMCVMVVTFLLGPLTTSLHPRDYFASPDTALYLLNTGVFLKAGASLPGVFSALPEAGIVNAPVWTIKYELLAYVLLAALFAATSFRRPSLRASVVAILALLAAFEYAGFDGGSLSAHNGLEFVFCFMLGVALYAFRNEVVLDWRIGIAAALALAATIGTHFECLAFSAMAALVVLAAGAIPLGRARALANANDISFGTYLYGWPIAQSLLLISPGLAPGQLLALTLPIAWFAGLISWFLIERPIMAFGRHQGAGSRMREKTALGA